MTLSLSRRHASSRPKQVSCACHAVGCSPRQASLSAAGGRPVSGPCETKRSGGCGRVALPGGLRMPYESMVYDVRLGSGQNTNDVPRPSLNNYPHPPLTSQQPARPIRSYWRLEKWRGVRGEPFFFGPTAGCFAVAAAGVAR